MFYLPQSFENGEYQADLSDTPPHVIAAVLKLYLRQVSKQNLSYPFPIVIAGYVFHEFSGFSLELAGSMICVWREKASRAAYSRLTSLLQ